MEVAKSFRGAYQRVEHFCRFREHLITQQIVIREEVVSQNMVAQSCISKITRVQISSETLVKIKIYLLE